MGVTTQSNTRVSGGDRKEQPNQTHMIGKPPPPTGRTVKAAKVVKVAAVDALNAQARRRVLIHVVGVLRKELHKKGGGKLLKRRTNMPSSSSSPSVSSSPHHHPPPTQTHTRASHTHTHTHTRARTTPWRTWSPQSWQGSTGYRRTHSSKRYSTTSAMHGRGSHGFAPFFRE